MATTTLARPVQTYPYTTEQAIHAAKLWFVHTKPGMTLVDHFNNTITNHESPRSNLFQRNTTGC